MSPLVIGSVAAVALFVLIVIKVPIGIAMVIVGFGGFATVTGWKPALSLLTNDPAVLFASPDLACVPLFLLMGMWATAAGFSADIYRVAGSFLGHRRGGLAYSTIIGCAAFGSVCGSTIATAATFTKIALPEMLRRGYEPGFAGGSIAAGGALKALIPPSMTMILYCLVAQTFILDLFVAAALPALITIALNLIAIAIVIRWRPEYAPVSPRASWEQRHSDLVNAIPVMCLMVTVFGGLYSGIFTVNEAASVAAVLAFLFAVVRLKGRGKSIGDGLIEAARATTMVYIMIFGASIFGYFMTVQRVPEALIVLVNQLDWPPVAVIFSLLVIYLILGAFFDEIAAMLITVPFVLPVVMQLGYDPIWWGVINVIIVELGMIIPPIGMLVFVIHGMAPSVPLWSIYRGVTPLIVADLLVLVLLTIFPGIALWPLHLFQ